MLFYATSAVGYHEDRVNISSAESLLDSLDLHIYRHIARRFDDDLVEQVRAYMRLELDLNRDTPTRPWTGTDTLRHVAETVFSDKMPINRNRDRFQFMTWVGIEMQTALRVGAFFPHWDDEEKRGTKYGDFTLVVTKSQTAGAVNHVDLRFRPPHGKTANSSDLGVALQRTARWSCPVFGTMVLVHMDSAMPQGLAWEDLLDPATLGAEVKREFIFRPSSHDRHVFRRHDDTTWTTATPRPFELSVLPCGGRNRRSTWLAAPAVCDLATTMVRSPYLDAASTTAIEVADC